jgi:hypothetical protein
MKSRKFFLLVFCALSGCAAPANRVALPTPPLGEPGNIAGMDASRIRVAFGAPQFVRKDGATEMWRYDSSNCRAFFFFYPNGNSLAVRHVETLPHAATQAADSNCLAGLLARAKGVS